MHKPFCIYSEEWSLKDKRSKCMNNACLGSKIVRGFINLFISVIALHLIVATSSAQPTVDSTALISINIESSQRQLVAGTGLGVIAKIKNISDSTVYIHEQGFSLTLPLELEGIKSEVYGYAAFFPTESHDEKASYNEYFQKVISLTAGDTYSAFWTSTSSKRSDSTISHVYNQISSQLQFLFFSPGEYNITVTAKYWTSAELPEHDYRTVTKSVALPVAAPQFVILFGAALGGLIAYFIFQQARWRIIQSQGLIKRITREVRGMFGAVLLSVIVTILLSRISETQFVIRITVNDFWGAIAIGFIANYGGSRLIDKIILRSKPQESLPSQKSSTRESESDSQVSEVGSD